MIPSLWQHAAASMQWVGKRGMNPQADSRSGRGRCHIVAIGGPSCAGKSTLARLLAGKFPAGQAATLELDSYYCDRSHLPLEERAACNFDHPSALDWPLLEKHAAALADGNAIMRPVYDFTAHARVIGDERAIPPAPVLFIEGLLALYSSYIREKACLCLYVDLPEAACLERRISRDMRERGRTRD